MKCLSKEADAGLARARLGLGWIPAPDPKINKLRKAGTPQTDGVFLHLS